MRTLSCRLPVLLLLPLLGGCEAELPSDLGPCEEGTELTWTDVDPIFAATCAPCHDSALATEAERSGAPPEVNYDTPEAAANNGFLTWSEIWIGRMPKEGEISDEDALLVWEWLSCEEPS